MMLDRKKKLAMSLGASLVIVSACASVDPQPRVGNIATVASSCEPLGDSNALMAGLRAGWVIDDYAPLPDHESAQEGDWWTLQFSTVGLECSEPLLLASEVESSASCAKQWQVTIVLPASMREPGLHDLRQGASAWLTGVWPLESGDCNSGSFGGLAQPPDSTPFASGTLEIFSDDADCMTGRIDDFDIGLNFPSFEIDGGFYAQTCGS